MTPIDPLCNATHDGRPDPRCTCQALTTARLQGPVAIPSHGIHPPFCFCPTHAAKETTP